jgi:hypothetical protein
MGGLFESFGGILTALFFVYLMFLALGVNLLPAWLSGRVGVAIASAAILVSTLRIF